jgi:hypothetical protein
MRNHQRKPFHPVRILHQYFIHAFLNRFASYPIVKLTQQSYSLFCPVLPNTIRTIEKKIVTRILGRDIRWVENREVANTRQDKIFEDRSGRCARRKD